MKSEKAMISTSDVPPQFWQAAFLVGNIPFRSVANEQRVSYTLYIPESHYRATLNDPVHIDTNSSPVFHSSQLRLIVNIHGTRRVAERCRDTLIPFADEMGVAVLAPLFPAAPDGLDALNNYKTLRQNDFHADAALLAILDEVSNRWPGIATDKVFMMGFSGGGQFAHRFMYLYPERLHAVSIGAPGQTTRLDTDLKWPAGVMDVEERFGGIRVDPNKIQQIQVQLIGGALDTETHGGDSFWEWLKVAKAKYVDMGDNVTSDVAKRGLEKTTDRLGGLKQLQQDLEAAGVQPTVDIVPDAKHEAAKMLPFVIGFFRPLIEAALRINST